MKIVIVSGGFDPIHSGHISYLKDAKNFGDKLIVALNSDEWLDNKKGKSFMPFSERKIILENINYVDEVIDFEDDQQGSAIKAIEKVKSLYPNDQILFANGGDRDKANIPEMVVDDVEFIFGIGGNDKMNSSSWILKNWKYYFEERIWGSFYNLFEDKDCKVKELIVDSGKGMSFQKHFKRNEIWLITRGACVVNFSKDDPNKRESVTLKKFNQFNVNLGDWHQITNPFKEKCHIIEIQYGDECIESDIERLEYYQEK
tara:strand:+ start:27 stop:800 length:774 start_codon:yes stop_codon:yes gene_type:complete